MYLDIDSHLNPVARYLKKSKRKYQQGRRRNQRLQKLIRRSQQKS